jgi:hypothetical protein
MDNILKKKKMSKIKKNKHNALSRRRNIEQKNGFFNINYNEKKCIHTHICSEI